MIYKIQRPLDTNTPDDAQCLAYTEGRQNQAFIPLSACRELFPNGEAKVYVNAEAKGDRLVIHGPAETQAW